MAEAKPTYLSVFGQASVLCRQDQINLARAVAGLTGMVAQFPSQLGVGSAAPSRAPKGTPSEPKGPKGKGKKVAVEPVRKNPIKDSDEDKRYKAAQAALKAARGTKSDRKEVPENILRELEAAKAAYFEALTAAKAGSHRTESH